MEVSLNSKKVILKSFLGWLPIALVSLVIYGLLFVFLIMWLLMNIVGFDEALARQVGWVIGVILLALSSYAYLSWLTNSLSSYCLSIENDELRVKGKAGWNRVDTELPVNEIEKIYIGQNANAAEKLSSGHGVIRDQVDSRLTFFPTKGKPFKLDFAAKAFDNDSLYDFLVFAQSKGIETNVSV
tara:strand:+ start:425 stop:976 length:552 start_codon:yes stop_codon:yes gene_type:complete